MESKLWVPGGPHGQQLTTVQTFRCQAGKIKACAQSVAPVSAAKLTWNRSSIMGLSKDFEISG